MLEQGRGTTGALLIEGVGVVMVACGTMTTTTGGDYPLVASVLIVVGENVSSVVLGKGGVGL